MRTLITPPTGEPLSLAEAKAQVQQGTSVDDSLLGNILIPTVRDRCEIETRRRLLTQTWDLILDAFPACDAIEIPHPPLVSVTYVKYYNTAGTLTTLTVNTDYKVQAPSGPRAGRGRVYLPFSVTWPATLAEPGAVLIRFVCGYGAAADVPPLLKQAMLLDLGTLYANREGVISNQWGSVELPMGVRAIYGNYRSYPTQRAA